MAVFRLLVLIYGSCALRRNIQIEPAPNGETPGLVRIQDIRPNPFEIASFVSESLSAYSDKQRRRIRNELSDLVTVDLHA